MAKRDKPRTIDLRQRISAGVVGGGVPGSTVSAVAGPDIDVSGATISRAGNRILLFSRAGALLAEFAYSDAGLDAAEAAASAGDIVLLPPGTWAADHAVKAQTTLRGSGVLSSMLTGLITLDSEASLENLNVTRTANDATTLIAVLGPAVGGGFIRQCNIVATQSGAGSGYALSTQAGNIYIYHSRAVGSTATTDA